MSWYAGAQEAGSMDAKGQTSNKDLDSQGRAPSKGSINIFGTCSIKSEGEWEKGGNQIRDPKIKHLL